MKPRRRFPLALAAIALPLTATAAAPAAGPLDFRTLTTISDGNPATNDSGYARVEINATAFKNQSLVTSGNYQFTSYYGADGKLIVGRRNLQASPGTWTLRRTQFTSTNINDSHNVSTIALDGDGFLHVAWGLHDDPLLYTRSTTSVINDGPLVLNGDTVGNSPRPTDTTIPLETANITYPEFTKVPGASGDLMLAYRTGGSGNGEYQLARWNNANNVWAGVRTALNSTDASTNQPWIDNDFGGDALPDANAYHNGLVYGSGATPRLHATWTWRTGTNPGPFDDFQSNHNLMYAYSDNDGVDWRLQNGTLLQRNGRHDIDESNATPVLNLPMGSSLINQSSSAIDPSDGAGDPDRLYVATWFAPNAALGNHSREYMLIEFDGGSWETHQIGDRADENSNNRVPESQLGSFRMSRPIVLVDEQDRVFVVFSDHQRGQGVTVAYSESAAHDDWQYVDLAVENMGLWEPKYDLERWARDGVLSMLYQPAGLGSADAPVSLLEWDARGYFATVPEPGAPTILAIATAAGLLRRRRS